MSVTSNQLIAQVKRLMSMPSSQSRITNADILGFADRQMRGSMVPILDSLSQEYFTTSSFIPIIAGQAGYDIPHRAIGLKLRDLKIVSASLGGGIGNVLQIPIEHDNYFSAPGVPFGFHFFGDRIQCIPAPSASGSHSFQVFWYQSPGRMVETLAAAQIQLIVGDDVHLSNVPASFVNATLVDFIIGGGGNGYRAVDQAVGGLAGDVLSFAVDSLPMGLAVGDWVSLAGESPFVQLPTEACTLFETLIAADCCYAVSDYEGRKILLEAAKDLKTNLLSLLQPRITGEPDIIMSHGFKGRRNRFYLGGI